MRELKETPAQMVVGGRVSDFGVFKEPFREINLLDVDMDYRSRHLPRIAKDFRLKEWQHFGIVHEDYYFGMVIFDAKFMGLSFFYAVDRNTGDFFEHNRTSVGGPVRVARELWHGECYFRHIGYLLEFENRLDCGLHRIRVDIGERRDRPEVKGDLYLLEDLDKYQPLVVVSPIEENRPLYTHKAACPVEGTLTLGDREIELDGEKHVGLMDVQKTFYPYRTFWKWATFGGYDSKGRLVAFNACQNFISNDRDFNENCAWVDGRISLLSAARFEFDEGNVLKPWRLKGVEGDFDIEFDPRGERSGKINLGLVMSDFHQPFGVFRGEVTDDRGKNMDIDGEFGVCEHHLARF